MPVIESMHLWGRNAQRGRRNETAPGIAPGRRAFPCSTSYSTSASSGTAKTPGCISGGGVGGTKPSGGSISISW